MQTSLRRTIKPGVTLIAVAGVLAVLAALAGGFYTLMVSQLKSAVRFSDSVRAEMLARAGVQDAIAQLRKQVFEKTEDPSDPWYTYDCLNGGGR
jgi:type II secretory pathway component PulK